MKAAILGFIAAVVLVLAVVSLIALALPTLVRAEEPGQPPAADLDCGTPEQARAAMAHVGQREASRVITIGGTLLQLYTASGGAPWSILMTKPGGETCLLVRGLVPWETIIDAEGSL